MDIDRKTKQSEVRDYEEVDQVSEIWNEKKHGSLVKTRQTKVLYYDTKLEWLLKNEEEDNKQDRSLQKEKEIYKECKEKQGGEVKVQESGKTEGGLVLAKSLEAIISSLIRHRSALIAPKSTPVVSTNNSAL
ncbi:40870_t:CDS:2, partial [Gigaspora margarita]